MANRCPLPWEVLNAHRVHGIFDDFDRDVDAAEWVSTLTDSGTASVGDAAKGILALVASDGTVADNDEAYIESPNETFLFAAGKAIAFGALVQFTEANTDDANVFVGLLDAVGANTLVDDGAGPKTTASGVGFFKVDGGTTWNIFASLSTTQTKVNLTAANSLDKLAKTAGGASYQRLEIVVIPKNTTQQDVEWYIDGVLVYKLTDMVFTSATEMQIGAGVKNGGANNETLNIDYIYAYQIR